MTQDIDTFVKMALAFGRDWRALSLHPNYRALRVHALDFMRELPEEAVLSMSKNTITLNDAVMYLRVVDSTDQAHKLAGMCFQQVFGGEYVPKYEARQYLKCLVRHINPETAGYESSDL